MYRSERKTGEVNGREQEIKRKKATVVSNSYKMDVVRSKECLTTAVLIRAVGTVRLFVTLVAGRNAGLVTQTCEMLRSAHVPRFFSSYTQRTWSTCEQKYNTCMSMQRSRRMIKQCSLRQSSSSELSWQSLSPSQRHSLRAQRPFRHLNSFGSQGEGVPGGKARARTHTIINADMLHQKSNRDLRLTTIELITPIAAVAFSVTHIVSGDALSVLTRGLIGAARPETLGDFNLRRGAWYLNGWKSSRFFRCCQKREGSSHSLRKQISHQQVFHYCL